MHYTHSCIISYSYYDALMPFSYKISKIPSLIYSLKSINITNYIFFFSSRHVYAKKYYNYCLAINIFVSY